MATLVELKERRLALIKERKKLRSNSLGEVPRNIENRLTQDIKRLDREILNAHRPKKAKVKDPLI